MINAIINGIFKLILSLFNALLSPVFSAITALFPALGTHFTNISNFLGMGLTYIRSLLSLLCISDSMITTLLDYFVICYTIYLTMMAVRFAITIYNKFKI